MELRQYLKVLRKRWPLILAVTLIGLVLAVTLVKTSTKTYTASAQIFVAASSADSTTSLNNGNSFAQARVQSYTSTVNSPTITAAVVKQLGLQQTPDHLANEITADAPLNKVLLNLHVTDRSPELAARIANAVASRFVTYVEGIEQTSAGSQQSPVKLTVIHPAQVPGSPTSPKVALDLIVGGLAGLLIGLALAVASETLDTKIRTVTDIGEISDASILAAVPQDKKAPQSPIAARSDGHSQRSEAFRQLRTNLQYIDVDHHPRLIAVTSAMSGEGKSSTAANLAYVMADADFRVCLIDADLRRPSVAKYFGLASGAGLTSLLAGKAALEDVLQPVTANLTVLTSGPIPPNPSELLASAHFSELLKDLVGQVDYVIVDTAPLLPVADGSVVASKVDVTLLVAQARRTNKDQLKQALSSLARVDAKLGGIVFNMVSNRDSGTYYEYYASPERASHRTATG